MNNRSLITGGLVVAGVYAFYAMLPIETKERVMNKVRGFTDNLPENIKAILPSFLLSVPGVVDKEVYNTAEKLTRVN